NRKNVCAVGDEIAKQLNNSGITTIHDKTQHDNPSYSGAYDRSLETINSYLEKYPSIKVVLDIHRDGIGTDTEKSKPVFTVNGKKAAQIMILSGYNYDDSDEFKDWKYNLRFALQIQSTSEKMYPNMVRPLYFADFMYNMNVNTGSLLIEVGSDSNTLEEARYSGYLLGKVLVKVLKNNMQ
ncbi:MAG: stage II sporulation protein P, partial [Clostridia bacterium]|nr:stage II sporulation protein P [Clostridia bacterium]